jgi:D-alanyl-D-alanine carboxypeptidase/D-alanyl-D-alanine-endopeptidase (penicillin-binding protein 4)
MRGDPSFAARFHRGDGMAPFRAFAAALRRTGLREVTGDLLADESHFNGPRWGRGWTWDELEESYAAEVSALSAMDNVVHLNVLPGSPGEPVRLVTRPRITPFQFENRTVTRSPESGDELMFHRPFGGNRLRVAGGLGADIRGVTRELTVARPAEWFGLLLRQALEEEGVRIDGRVRAVNWQERLVEPRNNAALHHLASVSSPPIPRLVEVMMKESQNLYAQLLLMQVGSWQSYAGRSTDQAGLQEMDAFLRRLDIHPEDVRLEEGSGLSRRSRVTASAMVRLLERMDQHPRGEAFRSTLPLAGVDGTLSHRFKGSPAERRLWAKTGTLNQVCALAGYVENAAGHRHAFAILLNNHPGSGAAARAAVDALASEMAR